MAYLDGFFHLMKELGASDLHLSAGDRPKLRIDGEIVNSGIEHTLTPRDTLQLAYSVLTENQKKRFEMEDESFDLKQLLRCGLHGHSGHRSGHTSLSFGLKIRSSANPSMAKPSPVNISSVAGSSTQ